MERERRRKKEESRKINARKDVSLRGGGREGFDIKVSDKLCKWLL